MKVVHSTLKDEFLMRHGHLQSYKAMQAQSAWYQNIDAIVEAVQTFYGPLCENGWMVCKGFASDVRSFWDMNS